MTRGRKPADANRTVPAGASAHDRHKGYTYVEYYINELADNLAADALKTFRPDAGRAMKD